MGVSVGFAGARRGFSEIGVGASGQTHGVAVSEWGGLSRLHVAD